MNETGYIQRRGELAVYFDRTAVDGWKKLVSTDKVSRIRQTVREGRDRMRAHLISRLPDDLSGWRILDAGCGSGVLAYALALRGADVLGVDLSAQMIDFAAERYAGQAMSGTLTFKAGDMLSPDAGRFDAVVAMDSLIHYEGGDVVSALSHLAEQTSQRIIFTIAPRTPALAAMHNVGKLFPRSDRSPAIVPIKPDRLVAGIDRALGSKAWSAGITERVSSGFYISQGMEVIAS